MEFKVDKDDFEKFVADTLRKQEQLGSIIFPATGNEKVETLKAVVKERIKLCKNILKQLKQGNRIEI